MSKNMPHSSGLEKILMKAATDEVFRESLLNDREKALEKSGNPLNSVDKMLLMTATQDRLEGIIKKFIYQRTSRRNFLKGAAASVALITGTMLLNASCICYPVTGARPDFPETPNPVMSAEIGAESTRVYFEYNGLSIDIPEKALKEPVNISIETIPLPLKPPDNVDFRSETLKFSPENLTFLKDIQINFPLHQEKDLKGYYLKENKWEEIPGELNENYFTIKTRKFGVYTLGSTEEEE